MLVVNIVLLLVLLIGYLLCLKSPNEWTKNIDTKDHKLYFLYPLANCILTKTGLEKLLFKKSRITDSIKALYLTNKPELIQKLYWCSRISLVLLVFMLFNLFSLMGQLEQASNSVLIDGKYILRPEAGEGNEEVELNVKLEQTKEGDTSENDGATSSQEVTLHIQERAYTQAELNKIFDQSMDYLKNEVLGNNESTELIYEDLVFCTTIPGTSITVEWIPDDYNLVQSDGSIKKEGIEPQGVITNITAVLTYQEQQKEFVLSLRIMPKEYSKEETLIDKLEQEISAYADKSASESHLELPQTLENYHLQWTGKEDNSGLTIFLFGILIAVILWLFGDKELEAQMKKRKEQMMMDYPEIINKFTLLVNAGMTVKQAWSKIVEDYKGKDGQNKSKKRYAYEEMVTTVHELMLGLPESVAYEQFGRRIGLIPYIKFSSLISQNLKKGNRGFTELLVREAIEAFEDRKEIAKRLGEEAGTKLLAPMMVMLIIVFVIILIPAFWSFRM